MVDRDSYPVPKTPMEDEISGDAGAVAQGEGAQVVGNIPNLEEITDGLDGVANPVLRGILERAKEKTDNDTAGWNSAL